MLDLASPLEAGTSGLSAPNSQGEIGVHLSDRATLSLAQIAAWPDTLAKVKAAVATVAGLALPEQPGQSVANDVATVMAIGPGKILIEGHETALLPALQAAIGPAIGTVTDLSHARWVFRISGSAAEWVLAKGLAIDLDPAAFPLHQSAASAVHGIGILVRRAEADAFDLYVPRSFARAFWHWLTDAAAEVGYRAG